MIPNNVSASSRWISQLPPFVRRALQVDQMELDSALSQMYSLCTKPHLVSKMSRARRMTKNHYYRDDPAFLVLQLLFIVVSTVACGLIWGSFTLIFINIAWSLLGYAFFALIGACIGRMVAVSYLSKGGLTSVVDSVPSEVDWRYSFDVHCNGYFTYFIWTQVVQYYFLLFSINSAAIGNTFYAIGCSTYLYNVFLGYLEIPSLSHQQRLLYPVLVVGALWIILTLSDINLCSFALKRSWD